MAAETRSDSILFVLLFTMTEWTLAEDFNLDDGEVEVTLPSDVATRDDYIIVLFGDSGNKSDRFSITGTAAAAPAKRDFYRDDMIVA